MSYQIHSHQELSLYIDGCHAPIGQFCGLVTSRGNCHLVFDFNALTMVGAFCRCHLHEILLLSFPLLQSPAAPVLAVESAVKGSEQRGGEAAQAPSTGGTSIISPLMAQGGMAAVVRDGASDAAVQVPAESSHAGGAVSGGAAAVPGDAMNMGAVREALAQAAGANTAAEPADVDDKVMDVRDFCVRFASQRTTYYCCLHNYIQSVRSVDQPRF